MNKQMPAPIRNASVHTSTKGGSRSRFLSDSDRMTASEPRDTWLPRLLCELQYSMPAIKAPCASMRRLCVQQQARTRYISLESPTQKENLTYIYLRLMAEGVFDSCCKANLLPIICKVDGEVDFLWNKVPRTAS